MAIAAGQKGAYRPIGSNGPWKRVTVTEHPRDKPLFFALTNEAGTIEHFDPNTGAWSGTRDEAGGEERVAFSGNLMISQPGDKGAFAVHEWVNLV